MARASQSERGCEDGGEKLGLGGVPVGESSTPRRGSRFGTVTSEHPPLQPLQPLGPLLPRFLTPSIRHEVVDDDEKKSIHLTRIRAFSYCSYLMMMELRKVFQQERGDLGT